MCVLAAAWNAHPRWRLLAAANRDEDHGRPSAPLSRWTEPRLIAGRDLSAGGTWLAVSEAGRFAAVTNVRGAGTPRRGAPSRGLLVADLAAKGVGGVLAAPDKLDSFGAFNSLVIDVAGAFILTNAPVSSIRALSPGVHTLSNGPLAVPWRKSSRLGSLVAEALNVPGDPVPLLLDLLRDPAPPTDEPESPAAIFVDDPIYGTRCSTVVAIDIDGNGTIAERRYHRDGTLSGETRMTFSWPVV